MRPECRDVTGPEKYQKCQKCRGGGGRNWMAHTGSTTSRVLIVSVGGVLKSGGHGHCCRKCGGKRPQVFVLRPPTMFTISIRKTMFYGYTNLHDGKWVRLVVAFVYTLLLVSLHQIAISALRPAPKISGFGFWGSDLG